ncbi:hypothetical protein [Chitinophaga rhizophila]|uniref:Uncharacterized protein n=1 Tax=Chitinophaga rhizophila TaxID=2866212 RepID=A0ABS7G8S7_9BACT|nr:hypothetical protein [Chitinophaga rhizophila]MBW8683856.1 hypothetical protein [Chitinophaga rhizophila]
MINNDSKNKATKDNNEDASIKPDPETLGPEPQEHMEGPISSIIKKIEESADDNFGEDEDSVQEKVDRKEEHDQDKH